MDQPVFAHYYTWFSSRPVSGEWRHWNWRDGVVTHDPDRRRPDGRRDIASVLHPLCGAYDSSLKDVLRWHGELAKAAGLNAFCVDWYGPEEGPGIVQGDHHPTVDRNFKALLSVAEAGGLPAAVCYEEKILTEAVVPPSEEGPVREGQSHFRYIAERYFPLKGYWKLSGRPVVVIWGNHSLSASAWRRILSVVEEWDPVVFCSYHWPRQRTLLESRGLLDGFYPWMNIKDLAGQRADLEDYYAFARASAASGGAKLLVGGVWPSFNDTGVRGWGEGERVIPDPKDELYDLTWDSCLRNRVEAVSIATWNDWNEGSVIEPSRELGYRRLEQTRAWVRALRGLPTERFDFSRLPVPSEPR